MNISIIFRVWMVALKMIVVLSRFCYRVGDVNSAQKASMLLQLVVPNLERFVKGKIVPNSNSKIQMEGVHLNFAPNLKG